MFHLRRTLLVLVKTGCLGWRNGQEFSPKKNILSFGEVVHSISSGFWSSNDFDGISLSVNFLVLPVTVQRFSGYSTCCVKFMASQSNLTKNRTFTTMPQKGPGRVQWHQMTETCHLKWRQRGTKQTSLRKFWGLFIAWLHLYFVWFPALCCLLNITPYCQDWTRIPDNHKIAAACSETWNDSHYPEPYSIWLLSPLEFIYPASSQT